MLRNKQKGFTLWELLTTTLGLACVYGYIANIVKLIGMDFKADITTELVLRIVGVLTGVVGAVMGYL